ncbi:hypothetical protein [Microbispora sp. H10885]|uniref:DUF7919 family protein n=1 Tax=Microbispora sp. H10885 TaxID=2729110 RepID=UPI001C72581E|nr:hypothetical protein [Microbispora sp. H10885]
MATYEDLSPYTYWKDANLPAPHNGVRMLNVGWLGRGREFETGRCAPAVLAILNRLASTPQDVMRGLHYCEFCEEESPIRIPVPGSRSGHAWLGTGEIHVAAKDGVVYSAPTLIVHYIDKHSYLPPAEFIEAVLRLP